MLGFGGSMSVALQASKVVFFSTLLISIILQMHWNALLCPTKKLQNYYLFVFQNKLQSESPAAWATYVLIQ